MVDNTVNMTKQFRPDDELKARIISHMNKDHSNSISLYLQHYHSLSARKSQGAKLDDVTLSGLTLSTPNGISYTIPLSPTMASLSESRTRLVAMDQDARTALGRSQITLDRFIAPSGLHLVVWLVCLITYTMLAHPAFVAPGGWAHDYILRYLDILVPFGSVPLFVQNVRLWILGSMLVIHGIEAGAMGSNLPKYNVIPWSGLWLAWVATTFVEGVGAFQRVNAFIIAEQKKIEKIAH